MSAAADRLIVALDAVDGAIVDGLLDHVSVRVHGILAIGLEYGVLLFVAMHSLPSDPARGGTIHLSARFGQDTQISCLLGRIELN